MLHLGLIKIVALALAVGVCLLVATAEDHELASVDLRHPTTLVSLVGKRLHALKLYVGARIDADTANFRKTVDKHEGPKMALER